MIQRSSAHRRVIAKVTGQEFIETATVELQPGQVVATAPRPGEAIITIPEALVRQAQSVRESIQQQLDVQDHEKLFESFAQGGEIPAGAPMIVGERVEGQFLPAAVVEGIKHFVPIPGSVSQSFTVTSSPVPDAWGYSLDHTEDDNMIFGHDDNEYPEPGPLWPGGTVRPVIDDGHTERTKQFTMTVQEAERRARALGIPSARQQQSSPTVVDKTQDILKAYELGLPYAAYVWLKMELKRIEDKVLTL